MSLTEYINQKNPVRMPKVILQEGEYNINHVAKLSEFNVLTLIIIPALWERYKVSGNYIQVNNESCLRTQDKDGNPSSYSCFYV